MTDVQIILMQKMWTETIFECKSDDKVKTLKWKLYKQFQISPANQRLFFEEIELDDPDSRLEHYGIVSQPSTLPIQFRIWLHERYNGISQTYFLDQAIFDRKWDRSYEDIARPLNAKYPFRGGKPYFPPLGCVRYGVKVLGKYENDRWLGGKGFRPDEEWPVAYHGTKEVNVLDILRNGFDLEKGVRFAFGKGIYCTPDPRVAIQYAFQYNFFDHNAVKEMPFKLIIQCRVDPSKLNIVHRAYGGVGVGGAGGGGGSGWAGNYGDYWLVPDGSAIRPYGICVYSALTAHKMVSMKN